MPLKRMDNVLIVVEDLEAVKAFFLELGLRLEGETTVSGPEVGALIGLGDVRATLAMLRTPDGQAGIELDKFHSPDPIRFGPVDAPVNSLGIRRVMFAVEDIGMILARMRDHGAELIGEMRYGNAYRLAYIRGPEGIIVGLAEEIRPAPMQSAKRPKRTAKQTAKGTAKRTARVTPTARTRRTGPGKTAGKTSGGKAARKSGGGKKRKT